jgi:hypothetical protein
MRMAMRSALIGFTVVAMATAVEGLSGAGRRAYCAAAAEFPESWLLIKPGMTSDEARRLVGEPSADGRDLKIVDRWFRIENGVEVRMDLWFDNTDKRDAPIFRVVRWKHFMGRDAEVDADPPWRHDVPE